MGVYEKLARIQLKLKAPKNLYNKFGQYYYRNAEGILEAVKPLLEEEKCCLTLSDDLVLIGDRFYTKATVNFIDLEAENRANERISISSFAREDAIKKGMDGSQITGSTSSYARKYALNGLFLLDDTKDADTNESHVESDERAKKAAKKAQSSEAPKPQNAEAPTQSIPLQAKQKILYNKCKEDNIDIPKLCMLYKKKNIVELAEAHLDNALNHWDGVVKMCKKVD